MVTRILEILASSLKDFYFWLALIEPESQLDAQWSKPSNLCNDGDGDVNYNGNIYTRI